VREPERRRARVLELDLEGERRAGPLVDVAQARPGRAPGCIEPGRYAWSLGFGFPVADGAFDVDDAPEAAVDFTRPSRFLCTLDVRPATQ